MRMSKGFSLVEIIVAMVILSLAVAGIFGMFVLGKKPIAVIEKRAQGMDLARKAMEHIKSSINADDFATLTAGDTGGGVNNPGDFVSFTTLSLPTDFADPNTWAGEWFYLVDNKDVNKDGKVDYKMLSVKVMWNKPTEEPTKK